MIGAKVKFKGKPLATLSDDNKEVESIGTVLDKFFWNEQDFYIVVTDNKQLYRVRPTKILELISHSLYNPDTSGYLPL